ncbi:UNVERIFIED_CONTAM: hypothetical protein Slati_1341700 [Sesamum latifolium]|uniref:Reverse transcriptase Ty1/copia-type domain-containing protein n=1 Tax=Sesamum latifolium TaxID=2727402 RepID=A0AAW2XIQ0_9LAMI
MAPEDYDVPPGHVCKLKCSLYGLKQASYQWNLKFTKSLLGYCFRQFGHDHYFFIKTVDSGYVGLLVYVDDVLIIDPTKAFIAEIKTYLDGLFTIKDLGTAWYFLGLQIARSDLGTSITQSKYILDIIFDCGFLHSKSVTTPLPQGVKLHSASDAFLDDRKPYHRPTHRYAALHMVKCLKGSSAQAYFSLQQIPSVSVLTVTRTGVHALTLADFLLGFVFFLVYYLLHDFDVTVSDSIPLHCDNQVVRHIIANSVFYEQMKYLDIDCHIVRDCYKSGFITPSFVRSKDQLADVFTKTLPGAAFNTLVCKLGLFAGAPSPTCGGVVGNMISGVDRCYWDPG